MGPYESKNFKTLVLQIAAENVKTFLKFLPNGPQKNMFGIFFNFWKLKCWRILFFFVNMGANESENFKTLLLQIAAKDFQTYPDIFPRWSSLTNIFF